jgi:hypothetical protein
VKQLAPALAALAMIAALEAQTPAAAPTSAPAPWLPRPVIIVDPRPYLSSPTPHPAHRATPQPKHRTPPHPRTAQRRRTPASAPAPETFERIETSPSPPPHRP